MRSTSHPHSAPIRNWRPTANGCGKLALPLCLILLQTACQFDSAGTSAEIGQNTGTSTTADDTGGSDTGGSNSGNIDATPANAPPVIGGCQIFPNDNFWNQRIDQLPVHPKSAGYIAHIGRSETLHPDFGTFWGGGRIGIPWNVVDADTPTQGISFYYGGESDCRVAESAEDRLCADNQEVARYPIPEGVDIEDGVDRHMLLVQRETCLLYEVFDAKRGDDGNWHAGSGAIWDLKRNEVRRHDDTSADAAGLPILPGLVKFDEVYRRWDQDPSKRVLGEINHALRVTLDDVQDGYMRPASHSDGGRIGSCEYSPHSNCPPMGLKLRLKADIDISGYSPPVQVILRALQRYGMVIADTGGNLYITGDHSPNWDDSMLREIRNLMASDFEVVNTGEPVCEYGSGGRNCRLPR